MKLIKKKRRNRRIDEFKVKEEKQIMGKWNDDLGKGGKGRKGKCMRRGKMTDNSNLVY